jgi:hypothetical protein
VYELRTTGTNNFKLQETRESSSVSCLLTIIAHNFSMQRVSPSSATMFEYATRSSAQSSSAATERLGEIRTVEVVSSSPVTVLERYLLDLSFEKSAAHSLPKDVLNIHPSGLVIPTASKNSRTIEFHGAQQDENEKSVAGFFLMPLPGRPIKKCCPINLPMAAILEEMSFRPIVQSSSTAAFADGLSLHGRSTPDGSSAPSCPPPLVSEVPSRNEGTLMQVIENLMCIRGSKFRLRPRKKKEHGNNSNGREALQDIPSILCPPRLRGRGGPNIAFPTAALPPNVMLPQL